MSRPTLRAQEAAACSQCATNRTRRRSSGREPTVKACIVGDSDVGKSSFLLRYTADRFAIVPATTAPESIIKIVEYMRFHTRLHIWDIPGQLTFRSIHTSVFRGAEVFIMMYDITKRDTFTNLNYWKSRIEDTVGDENLVYVMCGNKADMRCDRQVAALEGRSRAEEWGIRHFEISVKTGDNTDEVFKYIARQLHNRHTNPRPDDRAFRLSASDTADVSKCNC